MPILRDGPGNHPNVNAPLLAEIIYRWQASHVFVEYVSARPRSEAIRRWPDRAAFFARVKDDGRAEAALIAVASLQKGAAHRA